MEPTLGEYKDKEMKRYNKVDDHGRKFAQVLRYRTDGTTYYGKCYVNPNGKPQGDVIDVPILGATAKERSRGNFPTQKPLALYEIIVGASSNEGDWVLDPFCGCATTLVAAENLNRRWIGIDIWKGAIREVHDRMGNKIARRDPHVPRREDPLGFDEIERQQRSRGNQISGSRLRKAELPQDVVKPIKQLKKEKLGGRSFGQCFSCREWFSEAQLTIDHDPPRSRKGRDTHRDTELMCEPCNSEKGDDLVKDSFRRTKLSGRTRSEDAPDPNQGSMLHESLPMPK